MTHQEVLWKGKMVWVVSIMSKSGRLHRHLRKYIGLGGIVLGESKNGQLLVQFNRHSRSIPSGCVVEYGTVSTVRHGVK